MQLTSGHLYEFGPFILDTTQHLLLLQGKPVPLTPKTYDLLVVLVENNGRVMLKDELIKMVWVDSFVEDSNLTQQISAVRKALGETAGEDRYIVTVPGKGYRFAAAVTSGYNDVPPVDHWGSCWHGAVAARDPIVLAAIPSSTPGSPVAWRFPFQSLKGDSGKRLRLHWPMR
jgi:DNA-binding winged helix-turn-helix (wHTH) protein